MLILVNCQNVFLEKCESIRLRVMVDAAALFTSVHLITWTNPPVEAMGKKISKDTRSEYDLAVYPEIGKLNLPTSAVADLDKLPREFYQATKSQDEVFIGGCNAKDWLVKIALELWNIGRVRPHFIVEGWFTIGAPGSHGDALNELTRHFGAQSFKPWDVVKEPLLKKRAEIAAALAAMSKA